MYPTRSSVSLTYRLNTDIYGGPSNPKLAQMTLKSIILDTDDSQFAKKWMSEIPLTHCLRSAFISIGLGKHKAIGVMNSVRQWSRRSGLNPWSSHTKDSKNGT